MRKRSSAGKFVSKEDLAREILLEVLRRPRPKRTSERVADALADEAKHRSRRQAPDS